MSTYYVASRPITHQDIKKINKCILDDLAKNKDLQSDPSQYATINLSCELIEKTYAISYKGSYLIIFDYDNKTKSFTELGRYGGNRAEEIFSIIGKFAGIEFISEHDERYSELTKEATLH